MTFSTMEGSSDFFAILQALGSSDYHSQLAQTVILIGAPYVVSYVNRNEKIWPVF